MNSNVCNFLKKHGMHYEDIDMRALTDEFVAQMRSGNAGDVKSLMMIPTYVHLDGDVPLNEPIIVMDAGGTNFRIAAVTFDAEGKAKIDRFQKRPMLGTQGAMTHEEFFDTLARIIEPYDKVSDKIGFCFSFATEILPNCDGRILEFSKEVEVSDMVGRIIGEETNRALEKIGCGKKRFVIINDTVAALLGSYAENAGSNYDGYIGFILGTGTNTCYVEKCENIGRIDGVNNGTMAVNIESGGFDGFPRGDIDLDFDATTDQPGYHVFEKMISGAYQGDLILLTLKRAAEEGLFTAATAESISATDTLTMRQIDEFCAAPDGDNYIAALAADTADRAAIYDIVDCSFERAAKMVCVNLAAVIKQMDCGKSKAHPVCISAEGTTFYKSVLFRPKLDKYVDEFIVGELGSFCEFVKSEDSTVVGSAVAGLLN